MMVAYTVNIKYRRHYIKRAISYLTWEGFYYSAIPHKSTLEINYKCVSEFT